MDVISFAGHQLFNFLERKRDLGSNQSRKLLPCEVSKSLGPIFGFPLNTKNVRVQIEILNAVRVSHGRVRALVKEQSGSKSVDGGTLPEEFDFTPSFDEYLKAMESVRTGRDRQQDRVSGISGAKNSSRKEKSVSRTEKSGLYKRKKKFAKVDTGLRREESSAIQEDGLWQRNEFQKKVARLDNEGTLEAMERNEDDSHEEHKEGLGRNGVNDKLLDNIKGADKFYNIKLNQVNMRTTKAQKGAKYEVDDAVFEVERAAFRNFDEADDIVPKPPVSRVEMEQRIQKLAQGLNGADVDLPEWMFAKMMRSAKVRFSDHSIMRVIQLLGKFGNWRRVLQVLEWLQRQERFKSHKLRHIYTAALDVLGKTRRPVEALNVFNTMRQQISTYPDLVAYHSIAVTMGQAGHLKELFDVIDMMRSPLKEKFQANTIAEWDARLEPDIYVYNAVLNACVKRKQCEGAFWVLNQLKQQGQNPSVATYGLVMEVMFACGKYDLVQEFFRKAQESGSPNALTYRVLVNSLWKCGKTDEAVLAVEEMERRGIVGSAALYYDLARRLSASGRCQESLKQVEKICKVASKPLVVTYTGLIQACLEAGNLRDGISIFLQMEPYCSPNIVTCNIMLKAYLDNNMFEDAKKLFLKMLDDGNHINNKSDYRIRVIPDAYSFNAMLDACLAEKRWEDLEFVFKKMLTHGFCFHPGRHLHMIVEASRAGKGQLLETAWDSIIKSGCSPPPGLVKERVITMLEKDDSSGALSTITSPQINESFINISKKAWFKLFKETAHRFGRETLASLTLEARIYMDSTDLAVPGLQNFVASCDDFLRTGR